MSGYTSQPPPLLVAAFSSSLFRRFFLLGLSYNMHMQRNGGNTGWGDPSTKHNPTTPRQTPRTETKGPEGTARSAGRVLTYPRAKALAGRSQLGGLRLSGPPLSLFHADCGTSRGSSEP